MKWSVFNAACDFLQRSLSRRASVMVMRGPAGADGLLGIRSVEIWSVSVWMPGALQVTHLSSGYDHDVTACPVSDACSSGGVAGRWQCNPVHLNTGLRRFQTHNFCDLTLKWLWREMDLAFATSVTTWFVSILKNWMLHWKKFLQNSSQNLAVAFSFSTLYTSHTFCRHYEELVCLKDWIRNKSKCLLWRCCFILISVLTVRQPARVCGN